MPSVHTAGQADIRDQQVDAGVGLQDLEASGTVRGLDGGVAEILQDLRDEHPHRRLVVHDEHGLALLGARGVREGRNRLALIRRAVVPGQVEAHRGAVAKLRIDPDLPAGLAHEAVDHRQPEPRALADRLRREERLEGLGDHVRRHAGAGIGDAEREVLAGLQVPVPRRTLVHPLVGGLDGDAAAIRHRVARVDAEVQQRVLELRGIDHHRPEAGRGHRLEGDLRPDRAADQFLHAGHEPVHVGGLGIERLAAREGEQAVRQRGGALRGAHRRVHVAVDIGEPALADPVLQQLEAARDAGEQVVEVVRDPARELADRFHLLRLPQGRLSLNQGLGLFLLRRDVAAGGVDQPSFRHRDPRHPAVAAILVPIAVLEGRQALLGSEVQRLQGAGLVLGMDEIEDRAADHLLGLPAQNPGCGRAHGAEDPRMVNDEHQVLRHAPSAVALAGARLDALLQQGVHLAQPSLVALALG
ncbi:hypothetical protein MMMDOFMJ_2775 [Methylobacterium gnaphalii]|nr:hypothetical protein MMMDOFMJ_2775 [Methylobacterium gnaphalii]